MKLCHRMNAGSRIVWLEKRFRGTTPGVFIPRSARFAARMLILLALAPLLLQAREKNVLQYGEGLIVNIPLPEPEVAQAVEDAVQNTIIRGTKEYNRDEYIAGAVAAVSTPVFPQWRENGRVFYKVRNQALNPWNFKDSSDVGTLAVRYVVQPQGEKNTVLRIDAIFVEDFRHIAHPSNGSVESAEYKDIQDRLASVELVKKETAEALRAKAEWRAKQDGGSGTARRNADETESSSKSDPEARELLSTPPQTVTRSAPDAGQDSDHQGGGSAATASPPSMSTWDPSTETLEQHVAKLRSEVTRVVMKPGAPLKSAPFHTASTVKSLEPGAELLIQITTPYWYGVETHDGEHGWIRRDQVEAP
jgi:hypothetical protein